MDHRSSARQYDVSALKAIIPGTAPLAQTMKAKIIDYFGTGKSFERYGTTETNIASAMRPADQLRKIACIGQTLFRTWCRTRQATSCRAVRPASCGLLVPTASPAT